MTIILMSILLVLLIVLALVFLPGYTPRIKNSGELSEQKSIAELQKVIIGNSEQWVLIRSENIDNPILLFVHGGPGTSQLTLIRNNTRPIEKYFTVVNWDQRGAGKSYQAIRDKSRMTIDQFVSDLNELAEYLAKRFGKTKIILVGHSWGSAIGILAVSKRPELYSGVYWHWSGFQYGRRREDFLRMDLAAGQGCRRYEKGKPVKRDWVSSLYRRVEKEIHDPTSNTWSVWWRVLWQ